MSNMSYCRFRNTSADLGDCQDALEGIVNGTEEPLSHDELRAAVHLIESCCSIVFTICESMGIDPDDLANDTGALKEHLKEINAATKSAEEH